MYVVTILLQPVQKLSVETRCNSCGGGGGGGGAAEVFVQSSEDSFVLVGHFHWRVDFH